ncbi:lysozyme inhibitor LprI family protein [Roseateles sp. P5_E7]
MKKILSAALLCACFALPAYSASFDCAKAGNKAEATICASPELSALDEQLAAAYADVLSDHKAPDLVRASQRSWIKDTRNACADEACLMTAYQMRIAALRDASGLAAAGVASEGDKIAATDAAVASGAAPASAAALPSIDASSSATRASPPASGTRLGSGMVHDTSGGWWSQALMAGAVVAWLGVAILIRRLGRSLIVAVGGGFLAACLVVLGAFLLRLPVREVGVSSGVSTGAVGAAPANGHAVAPVFADLSGLKFGQHSDAIGADFKLVAKSAKAEETAESLRKQTGETIQNCFRKDHPHSGVDGVVLGSLVLCFDANSDRLVKLIVSVEHPSPETADLFALKRQIDRVIGLEGVPGDMNGKYRNTIFRWLRIDGGQESEVGFHSVPSGTVYSEKVGASYLNGRLPSTDGTVSTGAQEGDKRPSPISERPVLNPVASQEDPVAMIKRAWLAVPSTNECKYVKETLFAAQETVRSFVQGYGASGGRRAAVERINEAKTMKCLPADF